MKLRFDKLERELTATKGQRTGRVLASFRLGVRALKRRRAVTGQAVAAAPPCSPHVIPLNLCPKPSYPAIHN